MSEFENRNPAQEGIDAARADAQGPARRPLNQEQIDHLAFTELNDCLARIQEKLGVEWGDFASVFFSGDNGEKYDAFEALLVQYITLEND